MRTFPFLRWIPRGYRFLPAAGFFFRAGSDGNGGGTEGFPPVRIFPQPDHRPISSRSRLREQNRPYSEARNALSVERDPIVRYVLAEVALWTSYIHETISL